MIRENVAFWILLINLIAMIMTLITMLLTGKNTKGVVMDQLEGIVSVFVYLLLIFIYLFALGAF